LETLHPLNLNALGASMRRFCLTLLAGCALSVGAQAADLPLKAPVPVLHWNWTGCYIGIEGGGAWGRTHNFDTSPGFVGLTVTNPYTLSGGLIGGTIGCNYQFQQQWVIGIENDLSWTNKRGIANEIPPFNTTATIEVKERWIDTLRARLGHTFGAQDQILLYLTGGAAFAGTTAITCVPGVFCDSVSATRAGWTVGGGAELAIFPTTPVPNNWWSVKIEYIYVDFGSKDYNFNPALTTNKNISLNDHILRAGLNFHF
jgi:outer membrane immunogenic protein